MVQKVFDYAKLITISLIVDLLLSFHHSILKLIEFKCFADTIMSIAVFWKRKLFYFDNINFCKQFRNQYFLVNVYLIKVTKENIIVSTVIIKKITN